MKTNKIGGWSAVISFSLFLGACASNEQPLPDRRAAVDEVTPGVASIVKSEGQVATDDNRIVCKREKKLGTNISHRVCMTKAERDALAEDTQRGLRELNERAINSSLPTGESGAGN